MADIRSGRTRYRLSALIEGRQWSEGREIMVFLGRGDGKEICEGRFGSDNGKVRGRGFFRRNEIGMRW